MRNFVHTEARTGRISRGRNCIGAYAQGGDHLYDCEKARFIGDQTAHTSIFFEPITIVKVYISSQNEIMHFSTEPNPP